MVIDIAVIASLPHLDDLAARGSITMALTHLALAHPGYAAWHAAQAAAGRAVILDNSAYELEETTGAGMSAAPVIKAARLTGATEVVCSDVLYDGAATVTATRRFLAQARGSLGEGVRLMAVPQGSTRGEWLACYEALTAMAGVDVIGMSKLSVPRCWNAGVAAARLACVAALHRCGLPPRPLHLLGGDRCLAAELRAHRERGHLAVRSNDSSTAYWYAALGIPLDPRTGRAATQAPSKPDLGHSSLTPPQLAAAHANVAILREHAGLGPEPAAGEWSCPVPQRYIRVTTQAEGLHCWPDAPADEGYLSDAHRHLFTIGVRMQVGHGDREVEINAFTRWLHSEIVPALAGTGTGSAGPPDFGTQSCEHLAERITEAIRERCGTTRWIECEVLEDGILG